MSKSMFLLSELCILETSHLSPKSLPSPFQDLPSFLFSCHEYTYNTRCNSSRHLPHSRSKLPHCFLDHIFYPQSKVDCPVSHSLRTTDSGSSTFCASSSGSQQIPLNFSVLHQYGCHTWGSVNAC